MVRFLDAWTQLPSGDLLRWLLPAGGMALLVLMPGRLVARIGAGAVGLALVIAPDEMVPHPLRWGWVLLWMIGAWAVRSARAAGRSGARLGWIESGAIGLLLALALLGILMATIARADLPPEIGRRVSYGVLVTWLGLLHLMLRRHTVRLAIGLTILGFGLQVLECAAHESSPETTSAPATILLATMVAAALAVRVGRTRERVARSPWVSDAHDLHD